MCLRRSVLIGGQEIHIFPTLITIERHWGLCFMGPSVILQTFLNVLKSYIVIYDDLFPKYTSSNITKLQIRVIFYVFFSQFGDLGVVPQKKRLERFHLN